MLELKPDKMTYEALELRAAALEKEIDKGRQVEKNLRRQNEYLTALHETSWDLTC